MMSDLSANASPVVSVPPGETDATSNAALVSGEKWLALFPLVAFIGIFGGYVMYFSLIGTGVIVPIITSYNVIISTLFLPFLTLYYVYNLRKSNNFVVFLEVVLSIFIIIYINYIVVGFFLGVSLDFITMHIFLLIQLFVAFLIGRSLELNSTKWLKFLQFYLLSAGGVILYNSPNAVLVFDVAGLGLEPEIVERLANYQGFAFAYMIVAIYCVAYTRNSFLLSIIYSVVFLCLFVIGSRADLVAFCIVFVLHQFCRQKKPMIFVAAILVGMVVAFLFYSSKDLVFSILPQDLTNNRIFFFLDSSVDQSVVERRVIFLARMNSLFQSPFAGAFGSYNVGEYIHNILSVWVDLGFLGFLFFVALIFIGCSTMVEAFARHRRDADYQLALGSLVASVVLLLTTKYFAYPFFLFALGMVARLEDRLHFRHARRV